MRIGELSKATGVDVETIRYYEKAQLLSPPTRTDNGYRAYTQAHLERLAFIRHCRALDIPLAEIMRLLSFLDSPQSDCRVIDLLIDTQLAKVRARLASMKALVTQASASGESPRWASMSRKATAGPVKVMGMAAARAWAAGVSSSRAVKTLSPA